MPKKAMLPEGIIAHLPAQDVPAEGEHDHDPEKRQLHEERRQHEAARRCRARAARRGAPALPSPASCQIPALPAQPPAAQDQDRDQGEEDEGDLELGAQDEADELLGGAETEGGHDHADEIAEPGASTTIMKERTV